MMLLSWNCRGVKKPTTVQRLNKLLHMYRPLMLFLCETKCLVANVEEILEGMGYVVVAGMDSQGKSGGLILAVKKESSVVCSVEYVMDHCIHVKSEINKVVCYVSCVYGYSQV